MQIPLTQTTKGTVIAFTFNSSTVQHTHYTPTGQKWDYLLKLKQYTRQI